MKKPLTLLSQIFIVAIGILAVAFLIWEPTVEGVNVNSPLFEIYFTDPFLAYVYLSSVPFFVALYHAFRALGYIGENKGFKQEVLNALKIIKTCSISTIGFAVLGEIFIMMNTSDDRAGGVFMGVLVIFGSILAGVATTSLQRMYQKR
jgi:hypothetical protein